MATNQPDYSPLVRLLLGAEQKPRNRAEWEARFSHWRRSASETEELKIEAAKRRVNRALARSSVLRLRTSKLVPQGSYYNNTNVRADSDVDICVCLTDAFSWSGPAGDMPTVEELGLYPLELSYQSFRDDIASCLEAEYGASGVRLGNKAIHLHKDDHEKVSVDVVPTFTFRTYGPRLTLLGSRPVQHEGVTLWTRDGAQVTNFPKQHYDNGTAKNNLTGTRYKHVVRILKWMRNHMAANPSLHDYGQGLAAATPSFLIEGLVYNCPYTEFGGNNIYEDVVRVLSFLRGALTEVPVTLLSSTLRDTWMEPNGIKRLFRHDQSWTEANALTFVDAAMRYMGI